MIVHCIWEHNGSDTLLYAAEFPGAFARGASLQEALNKLPQDILSYCRWLKIDEPVEAECVIAQEVPSSLMICDADSDVLFDSERAPLTQNEYEKLKLAALKSARDFQTLYNSIPNHSQSCLKARKTFYSQIPRTAQEMYNHTRSVNAYYFGEIGVSADNEGGIYDCRERGFSSLEQLKDPLSNQIFEGSYGEYWTLRKVLRRFIWHDRIHAKAMYRMALKTFATQNISNPFFFG